MKFNKDIVHISLYTFFLFIGGVLGVYGNVLSVSVITLWFFLIAIVVRKYFISELKKEPIKHEDIIKFL